MRSPAVIADEIADTAAAASVGQPTLEPIVPNQQLDRLRSRRIARGYLRVGAVLGDVAAIVAAYLLTTLIWFGGPHPQALMILGVVLPAHVTIAASRRSYNIDSIVDARAGATSAITAFLITLGVVSLAVFFFKVGAEFSRATFGIGAVLAMLLIPASRYLLASASRRALGSMPYNRVIISDGADVRPGADEVVIDAALEGIAPRLDDPGLRDRLGRMLEAADRVVVMCSPERRAQWAHLLKGIDVGAEVVAPELDLLGTLGVGRYEGRSTLVITAAPLGVMDRALKRALDLVLTLAVMPFVLPVMGLVALAIRLESPGPILFAQDRVGLGNRLFKMYKFRSMYVDMCDKDADRLTSRDDPRVTRVGEFIRKTSLDELPQLLNVLKGDMSLVGPRPHATLAKAADQLYWDIDPSYWHRHAVKPGLTGLAQVRGYRGATERAEDLRNRLQADLEYLAGWTIWRDIKIIAATFRVLVHRNAF
jgi:exopolysaccharide biosynthesis polyprenyl glycosylphosphotransferase